MSAKTVAFVGALVYRFEELLPLLEEHLVDQEGEVLPHLFTADLERWAEVTVEEGAEKAMARLREVLAFLEVAYSTGCEEIEELIAVSFLEHLPRPGKPGAQLRSMVGPRLSEELKTIG
jgi:hypothetical protein